MDQLSLWGGNPLQGQVAVSGAKNAALPIMAAALAIPGETRLERIPHLRDIVSMQGILEHLGMRVNWSGPHSLAIEHGSQDAFRVDYELMRTIRAGVCVLGPLLARRKQACVSLPGGCNIGHRPIDLHLQGLAALGAEIRIEHGYVWASAGQLRGADIDLTGPRGSSVTGTCNVMTAACLALGRTVLRGAALEPEVVDLGNFLNRAGARIQGLGTSELLIDGVKELQSVEYEIIPDRIEAATWMIAAAATRGSLELLNVQPEHLKFVIELLQRAGVNVSSASNRIAVHCPQELAPVSVVAEPYPGFPTDVQAQWAALMTTVQGQSEVRDRVFPDRFIYAAELMRMGARIEKIPDGIRIQGVE
ncbi:MAG: UDP-N-acetylglucosamine 1-carboxyvinyltransferase, partial [Planctomycetaceae bacterium]|nr:UDP-N-acetylglucosamine 1-carboxyvinyltransferase [Planctomycetaceae bacterium]